MAIRDQDYSSGPYPGGKDSPKFSEPVSKPPSPAERMKSFEDCMAEVVAFREQQKARIAELEAANNELVKERDALKSEVKKAADILQIGNECLHYAERYGEYADTGNESDFWTGMNGLTRKLLASPEGERMSDSLELLRKRIAELEQKLELETAAANAFRDECIRLEEIVDAAVRVHLVTVVSGAVPDGVTTVDVDEWHVRQVIFRKRLTAYRNRKKVEAAWQPPEEE